MRYLLAFLLLMPLMSRAGDKSPYVLDTLRQVHDLEAESFMLEDPEDEYRFEDIVAGRLDQAFIPLVQGKKTSEHYWIRFKVYVSTPVKNWILTLKENGNIIAMNDRLESFIVQDGQVILNDKAGRLVPRSQKLVRRTAGFNGLDFSIPVAGLYTVYIKISNTFSGSFEVSRPVIQQADIANEPQGRALMTRLLNIISLMFCLLSLFFYFFVKERAYLLFGIYCFMLSQHYLILHSDAPFNDIYMPEYPFVATGFWHILTVGGFICFCLFGSAFMNLRQLSKNLHRYFMLYLAIWAALIIIESIYYVRTQQQLFPSYTLLVYGMITLYFFIRFAFLKSILARLFVGGALWLLCFTILGALWGNGVINLPFNPWPVGQVGQLLIFAAALAYKVRLNEKARAESMRIRDMDEIKSRFFANISHEFRTPLTLIQGPLQQIESEAKKNDSTVMVPMRHVKTMRRNTDRLLELVNQLLDLSKLDSGKMRLQVIRGDALQLLRTLTASFESVAERKAINYHVHFPEQVGIYYFDKDKLEKIFSNLLSNAFKYTPEGGTVSVNVEVEEHRLRFAIEDNGPGIPKKELDRIFDRFYQLEGTHDKGSGIGLALVKELVALYRGQISVSSEPGKGSRFRVSLPADRSLYHEDEMLYGEWNPEESFINRQIEAATENEKAGNLNATLPMALVVEDNQDLRQFIRETLEDQYQVLEATNGREGYEKAISQVPDIIISDVMMPLMDGFALTQKLKKDERTSHIPVILLTAKAGQGHKLEGLNTGADDYLTKPFDAPELLSRMQNLVLQRKLLRKKFAGEIILKPSEVAVNSVDDVFLQKLMATVETNMGEDDFGVEELSRAMAMSRSQLHRKLIALTGQTPTEVLRNTRLLRAKELLEKKSATPSEVAFQVGFNSHAYFSKCFKEAYGISPNEVR